jgi:putative glycosyltransferase (TIGR04372 family)|tara:strand:- start:12366 stop:13664 length:1299 start_codon:yes stop_codon:yes gene_type:complete
MTDFVERHLIEMREGGTLVVLRKTFTLLKLVRMSLVNIPMFLFGILCVLLVRMLRPLKLIRFGMLYGYRIGLAANIEVYLCERDAGLHGHKSLDIWFPQTSIANHQLHKMWCRILHVYSFAEWLDKANRFIPGGAKHCLPLRRNQDRDVHGLLDKTEPHLSFCVKEKQRGKTALRDLCIPDGASYICVHARDSAYLDDVHSYRDRGQWSHHDYRDSSIDNYIPAMREMVKRGYYVFRVGHKVREPIRDDNTRIVGCNVIDYATNGMRSSFLDIYLNANCRFFVGNTAGIFTIPEIFRRPIAFSNVAPLEYMSTSNKKDLVIPKKYWLVREKRFMKFREIYDSGAGYILRGDQFERSGIELIENSPEEITHLLVEMEERINGTWQTTEEDEALQKRFWDSFPKDRVVKNGEKLHGQIRTRIGTMFLRNNVECL